MIRTVSDRRFAVSEDITLAGDPTFHETYVRFTSLGQAGFAAISTGNGYPNLGVQVQLFDLSGHATSPSFQVPGAGVVTLTPDGNLLITWTAGNPYPDTFDIHAAFYATDGTKLGPDILVNTVTLGFQTEPHVVALNGGGYAIAWLHTDFGGGWSEVHYQVLSADGQKVGPEREATGTEPGDKYSGGLIATEDGGFLIAWNESIVDASVVAQRFGADGLPLGSRMALSEVLPGQQGQATVAALPDGNFVAAWYDDGNVRFGPATATQGRWVQIFDLSGQRIGPAHHEQGEAMLMSFSVTETGFTLIWRGDAGTGSSRGIWGQAYSLSGQALGSEFQLAAGDYDTVNLPSSTGLANGAFIAGWSALEGFDENIVAQIYYRTQQGTAGDDVFAGTAAPDFYFGGSGADALAGGAGDDGLSGEDGDDQLDGGAGDDVLDGGAGADAMAGGAGDDRYSVDSVGDQVIELAGGGTDVVETSLADYALGEAVENLVGLLGAGAIQTLRGNALSNELTGGAADNIFHLNLGGHDTVRGGDGQDAVIIDWSAATAAVTTQSSYPNTRFVIGTAASVVLYGIETITLLTGSGADRITTPPVMTRGLTPRTNVVAGGGDDIVTVSSPLDSVDGGAGVDGVFMLTQGATTQDIVWRIPSNIFLSPAGTVQLSGIEYFVRGYTGSGNDIIETGTLARGDSVYTGPGDDEIIVYNGADTVEASDGDDLLVIDWREGAAAVTLAGGIASPWNPAAGRSGSATDRAGRSVSFFDIERLHVMTGGGSDTLSGLSGADEIDGGAGDDAIQGLAGNDVLRGGAGNDSLDGGAGDDQLFGGAGDDLYYVDGAGDAVTELAGEGTDEIRTALGSRSDFAAMYTLPANIENLTGISTAGQGVFANALNNVVNMGSGGELVVLEAGGNDIVSGGGGDDFLYWGAAFNNADRADGGAGFDTVGLLGSYSFTFDADDLVSVEKLAFYSSGNSAAPNGYSFTMNDGNVAAGQQMMIVGQSLLATEAFTFEGAAETDGSFNVRGGRGADTITGGAKGDTIWGALGADTLKGGAGNDVFEYLSTSESTAGGADVILDFAHGDKINLAPIDADGNAANGDTRFTWLGEGAFTGQAGQLRVSHHPQFGTVWVVEADTDGDSVADFTLYLVAPVGFLPEKNDFYV